MTYSQGSTIAAADFNSFAGTINNTTPYGSSAAAVGKVAALWGVGYGDRGYGQTLPSLSPIASGSTIAAQPWLDLRTAITNIASYQGSSVATLPPTTEFVVGSKIKADVLATTVYDFAGPISTIDTNRFNTNNGASLSVTTGSLTVTRATSWGSSTTGITTEITAAFASENAARYFFNSGGGINLSMTHTNVVTSQNLNWHNLVTAIGTVSLLAKSTTKTGTVGSAVATGFYNLTGVYQTIFTATGTGQYTANTVTVDALVTGVAGVNGGNGTTVKIRIKLTDGHTNSYSDIVSSGTAATFGFKKAALVLTGIASPTFTTITNF